MAIYLRILPARELKYNAHACFAKDTDDVCYFHDDILMGCAAMGKRESFQKACMNKNIIYKLVKKEEN